MSDQDPARSVPSAERLLAAFRAPPQALIDVGDARLAYRRFGAGPDVVFIHGWPLSSATFRRVVPLLAGEFTCHLFDLPGAGQSEPSAGFTPSFASYIAASRALVDALDLKRYSLVAHDSGAVFARALAASDSRVSGLVIGNTEIPGHRPRLVELFALLVKLPGGSRALLESLKLRRIRHSFLGFGGCFADPAYADGEFFELFVEPLLTSSALARQQMDLLKHIDWSMIDRLAEVHAKIRAPTRLVWGSDDPFFPIEKAKRTLNQFGGGATLHEIPKAKLFCHEDFPEEFAHLARPVLAAKQVQPSAEYQ